VSPPSAVPPASASPHDDTQEQHVTDDAARDTSADTPTFAEVDEVVAAAEVGPHDAPADEVSAEGPPVLPDDEPATPEDSPDDHEPAGPWSLAPDEVVHPDPRSKDELLAELGEAESRRDEYLDDLRRARAEFENFRKRTLREGGSQRAAGKADVATSLLEVLDDLDRTLDAAEASADESLAKGVTLVADKLVRALQAQGLERVAEPGVVFDPNVHEAVQQRPSDAPRDEPVVAEVLRPGYRLGDRILRAAMVVVEQ
jgi:molecular chaperone GrpE